MASANATADLQLVKGETYRIRLTNGGWTDAVFLYYERRERSWANMRAVSRWHFRNVSTGREVQIKSREKIRAKVKE